MSESSAPEATSFPFPVQVRFDRHEERLRVVVDAVPAQIDDLAVAVGPTRVRIEIERDGRRYDRLLSPLPSGRVFADDRRAIYHNGVLTVSLETAAKTRRRRSGSLDRLGHSTN